MLVGESRRAVLLENLRLTRPEANDENLNVQSDVPSSDALVHPEPGRGAGASSGSMIDAGVGSVRLLRIGAASNTSM